MRYYFSLDPVKTAYVGQAGQNGKYHKDISDFKSKGSKVEIDRLVL